VLASSSLSPVIFHHQAFTRQSFVQLSSPLPQSSHFAFPSGINLLSISTCFSCAFTL
jgi:hypothetical protein